MTDESVPATPWSAEATAVLAELGSDQQRGLTSGEASERLARYGSNELPDETAHSPVRLFLMQFADWMVGLLVVAGLISAFVGELSDTILIGLIVLGNAIIGFVQEWKAEKAVNALRQLSQPQVEVVRDGSVSTVAATSLVPGDVVRLRAGSAIPADSRILEATEAEADESPLTGESLPVEKNAAQVSEETPLPDRTCMLFCGTALTRGHATAVVTRTGTHTELGHIARMISSAESGPTPLQRRLSRLSRQLALIVLVICVAIFATGMLRESRSEWNSRLASELLLTAVSLAVAAIPEGLPAIVTIALALGSQRMARRKAIVRRLSAVETLGSVDVICSDKTGTLTQNRMRVVDVLAADNGQTTDKSAADDTAVRGLLTAAALCNDALMGAEGEAAGSATETALLDAAQAHELDVRHIQERWKKLAELPFSSARKRMSSLHQADDESRLVLVKGAAEQILERASAHGQIDPDSLNLTTSDEAFDRDQWADHAARLAGQGQRVLGVAARLWEHGDTLDGPDQEAESQLTLLGLLAIQDPVRPEAADAIARCQSAGIHTVMITGDHLQTARAIAQEAGLLKEGGEALSGQDLDQIPEGELQHRLKGVHVFARVAPEHKLQIVKAYQAGGAVVAMTGDGVNDAPALKQAEIGVAMGITGTDVSREASEMILADDNFATIVAAVEEGRVVYDNIRKFVAYLLTANTSEILVLFIAVLFGMPLPLLPVQILWINLVTDGLPALALGFEAAEQDVMQRKPRGRQPSIFGDGLGWMVLIVGSLMGLISLGIFLMYYDSGQHETSLPVARTALFTTLALAQLFYVLAVRSPLRTVWQLGLFSNYRLAGAVLLGIVLQLVIIYVPFFHKWFHTVSLTPAQLGLSVLAAAIPYVLVEAHKFFRRALAEARAAV